jgi:hypothetical protein
MDNYSDESQYWKLKLKALQAENKALKEILQEVQTCYPLNDMDNSTIDNLLQTPTTEPKEGCELTWCKTDDEPSEGNQ